MTLCVLHMSAYRFPLGRAPLAAVKCENGAIQPFVVSPMDGMNCGSIKEALYGGGIDRSLAASGSSTFTAYGAVLAALAMGCVAALAGCESRSSQGVVSNADAGLI